MSTLDPGKLTVIKLRAELTSRGLDVKGNKPVLVQRLKEAIEKETQTKLPDTSIADTSTEDLNTSQESINNDNNEGEKFDELPEGKVPEASSEEPAAPTPTQTSTLTADQSSNVAESDAMETTDATDSEDKQEQPMEEDQHSEIPDETAKPSIETGEEKSQKPGTEERSKGEKRRRTSPSPQRAPRRRSRSPIKEDEPEFDTEKVSLSWYDSDLNLQIDKQSLISGKPLNDGAFGYSWAGARTTHGVKTGKVCYEVKITEELKWDDIIKQMDDRKRENQRSDRRDRRRNDRRGGRDNGRRGVQSSKLEQQKSADKEKPAELDEKITPSAGIEEQTTEKKLDEDQIEESATQENTNQNNGDATNEQKVEVDKEQTPTTVETTDNGEVVATDKPDDSVTTEAKENGDDVKDEKTEAMEVEVPAPTIPISKHVFRCGWSISGVPLQLGEAESSYGFDSHGKFVINNEFVDYGIAFGVGDVISAYANIDDEKVELTYTVNGVSQGLATTIPRSALPEENFALFPHVLSRNYAFELNLGSREEPWFSHPSELSDYTFIQAVEDKCQGPLRPTSRTECEVVMMCGLPASGKSHWVQEILKENADKTYTIIGANYLLEKMTINGKPLKESYKNRWNIILDRLMKCVNTLVDKAGARRRNFIIDQTNVFPSAQRRKMRLFEGFKRRAVVVVVSDEEQAKRSALQEAQQGSKDVPDSTLLEMKANMSLPKAGDWLEEVKYVELNEEEAKAIVEKYNSEGKAAGFGIGNRRGGYRDNRGQPYRWNRNSSRRDYYDSYRDNRSYQNNRFRSQGGFPDRRSGPGSWNRDFHRDSRDYSRNNRPGGGGRQDRSPRDRNPNSYNRNPRSQGGRNQSAWQNPGSTWQTGHSWGGPQGGGAYQNWGQGNWGGQGPRKGGFGQEGHGQYGFGYWNYGPYPNN